MRRTTILVLLMFFLLSLIAIEAQAQCTPDAILIPNSTNPTGYNRWKQGAQISYGCYNCETYLSGASSAISSAASTWDAESDNYTFVAGGNIVWLSDWPDDPKAAAATSADPDATGYITGYTIWINGDNFDPSKDWTLSCEFDKIDMQSVMLHEFGHVLGLNDNGTCTNTVMSGKITRGDCIHSLGDLDTKAIDMLYNTDPAALLTHFTITPTAGGNLLSLAAERTSRTKRFIIEKAPSKRESFTPLAANIIPEKNVSWELMDPSGTPSSIYRLKEEEKRGRMITHAIDGPGRRIIHPPAFSSSFDLKGTLRRLEELSSGLKNNMPAPKAPDALDWDWILICPDSFLTLVDPWVTWRSYHGLSAYAAPLSEVNAAGGVKNYISSMHGMGAKYFVLLGDASDYQLWDDPSVWINGWQDVKPDRPAQPELDLIPMDYVIDTTAPDASMSYFTPYYAADLPKADLDDDGLPDVMIGRVPAHNSSDVISYMSKLISYETAPQSGVYPAEHDVSFWVQAKDLWGCIGDVADSLATLLTQDIPQDDNTEYLVDRNCPECLSYAERESLAVASLDAGKSLVLTFGTLANRIMIVDFLRLAGVFSMSKLEPNGIFPFLLGACCDIADCDMTENPEMGRPLNERFLFDDSRGMIAIFGPTRGTWQTGNYYIADFVLKALYQSGAPDLGSACMAAQRYVLQNYGSYYGDLARSYVFLGDPAIRLHGAKFATAVAEMPLGGALSLEQNYPNPFNPVTTISYAIPEAGRVKLVIYDVRGARVRTLEDAHEEPGVHKVFWNGKNDIGGSVASGIYFYRLRFGQNSLTKKMVLVR